MYQHSLIRAVGDARLVKSLFNSLDRKARFVVGFLPLESRGLNEAAHI